MNQTQQPNETRRILIAGKQGVGKSTWGYENVIKRIPLQCKYVIEPDARSKIWHNAGFQVAPISYAGKPGLYRFIFNPNDKTFLEKIAAINNAVIIFDDCLPLFENPTMYKKMENIFIRSRQANTYIVFILHGIASVPAQLWPYISDVIIFKTNDNPKRSISKIPDYEKLNNEIRKVNAAREFRAMSYVDRSQ